jgi:hypothetical protein
MLHLLVDWEYPHWMMMAGAILVAAGFIGLAFHRNRNGPINKPFRTPETKVKEKMTVSEALQVSRLGRHHMARRDVAKVKRE